MEELNELQQWEKESEEKKKSKLKYGISPSEDPNGYQKRWREANLEHHKEWSRLNHLKHKEKHNAWTKNYYHQNREVYKKKAKEYRRKNPLQDRKARMKHDYGITWEQFVKMYMNQGFCCKLCGKPFGGYGDAFIDHDHATGKIRGLLHERCNIAIGFLRDDPEVARKAAKYLELCKEEDKPCPE